MDRQIDVGKMTKQEKYNLIENTAWELLKFSPQELKKNNISPLQMAGAVMGSRQLKEEIKEVEDSESLVKK